MTEVKEEAGLLAKDRDYVWHSMKPYSPEATVIADEAKGCWGL